VSSAESAGAGSRMFRRTVAPEIEIALLEPRDAEAVFAAVERDRAYLREWLPWVDRTQSAGDVRFFIDEVVSPQWADNRGPQCGIWVDGELAGSVGCHPIDWANRACSIGYWIESRRQGQGIVTRSVTAMLDYLFDEMRLHRVVIQCGVDNHRSCGIPERLGFTKEGVLRQAERVSDRWVDLATWSILEDEWRQRRQR
jgi:ribosomal-protein-serine acetyltransferase